MGKAAAGSSLLSSIWLALLSGALIGLAFPPADLKPLAWIGLVPLLAALTSSTSLRRSALLGYLAGLVFFLINLHPLVSAHSWTGWAAEPAAVFARRMSRQVIFMNLIWTSFAVWCATFWAAWALVTHWLTRRRHGWLVLVAPAAWILLPEWTRSQTTFGFTWGFLGNATADVPVIRQAAALGGIWPLSALIVAVNVALFEIWRQRERPGWARRVAAITALVVAVGIGGTVYMETSRSGPEIPTAVVQHAKENYNTSDFSETGLDRGYFLYIRKALSEKAKLIMLPESIAVGATSLDGTPSNAKPAEWTFPLARWNTQLGQVLQGSGAVLVLGVDTVEAGEDHNTLVAWTEQGALGWYHKRRLVPFSEYNPGGWGPLAIRGKSQYAFGRGSQLIRTPVAVLGGFICQEVLVPWVTRASVRDGATLLVTGGNDGVFGDPAVARVHADAAQLRAVESGRYIARAMKTGISSIIDPHGRELVRSRSAESVVLPGSLRAREGLTPYVRYGDWMVWLAAGWLLSLMAVHFTTTVGVSYNKISNQTISGGPMRPARGPSAR